MKDNSVCRLLFSKFHHCLNKICLFDPEPEAHSPGLRLCPRPLLSVVKCTWIKDEHL